MTKPAMTHPLGPHTGTHAPQCDYPPDTDHKARLEAAERTLRAWQGDMLEAGRIAGQRDDEYPLQAVQRMASERARANERIKWLEEKVLAAEKAEKAERLALTRRGISVCMAGATAADQRDRLAAELAAMRERAEKLLAEANEDCREKAAIIDRFVASETELMARCVAAERRIAAMTPVVEAARKAMHARNMGGGHYNAMTVLYDKLDAAITIYDKANQ